MWHYVDYDGNEDHIVMMKITITNNLKMSQLVALCSWNLWHSPTSTSWQRLTQGRLEQYTIIIRTSEWWQSWCWCWPQWLCHRQQWLFSPPECPTVLCPWFPPGLSHHPNIFPPLHNHYHDDHPQLSPHTTPLLLSYTRDAKECWKSAFCPLLLSSHAIRGKQHFPPHHPHQDCDHPHQSCDHHHQICDHHHHP